jgi:hypothetical protein
MRAPTRRDARVYWLLRFPLARRGNPSAFCATLLKSIEKAQQHWELQRRMPDFEDSF